MPVDWAATLAGLRAPFGLTRGPDHVVELLNPAAAVLLSAHGAIGRRLCEVMGDPADGLLATLDRALRDGAPRRDPTRRELPDGRCYVLDCCPRTEDAGGLVGLVLHGVELVADPGSPDDGPGRERTGALLELAEALSRAVTPAEIGRLAATRAADLLGADAATVYVVGPEGFEQVHSRGWAEELTAPYRVLPLRRGRPLSDAVLDATPVWLEDAEQWRRRYPEMAPVHSAGGYEASAMLPLRVEDRNLGAAVFSFLRPRAFRGGEREYLMAVAAMCAQALDRARLYVAERAARAVAERERDRAAFLAEAGLLLDAPLSVEDRLRGLADLTVPTIADWCAVTLVRADRIEQIAVAHQDAAKVAFVRNLQEQYPPDPHTPGGSIDVARTGVPSYLREIPPGLLAAAARDDEHLELITTIGMRSAMVLPLLVRGRSLGSLTLVQAESGRLFEAEDLALGQQFAGRAALALDNARLYERQRGIARTLQAALLPGVLPTVAGLDLAARHLAQAEDSEVGGDVYDVVAGTEPGWCSVLVADVCGKGPEAAALTALIRHTLRAEAGHGLDPTEALLRLNGAILREAPGALRFATVAHADVRADPGGAALSVVSAGHLPPLVLRGDAVETIDVPGTLLGVFPDPELCAVTLRIGPGESVLLYTDGLTEARAADGAFYGAARLRATLARSAGGSAERIAEDVVADVLAFQGGRPRDDMAVLVLQASP